MSLIRYRPVIKNKEANMAEDVSGGWTSLTEYYKLHDKTLLLASDNAALKAEVERLRKAGDAMAYELHSCEPDRQIVLIEDWFYAKEGRDEK